ncbi:MAG: serine protease [Mesorhizobium sp.]|nr:serine protease [Mesorhizobium sp.]MBL8576812.1 serine protease [Mesorhizobium sp.]
MTRLAKNIAALALASTAVWAAPAMAQMGQASPGNGEQPRSAPSVEIELGAAKPVAPPKIEDGEASRAAPLDENKAVESFGVVTRSADGDVTRSEPSDELKKLVIEEMKREAGKGTKNLDKSGDPAFENEDEAGRQIFGTDDRVQIQNTKVYPFRVFGYIQAQSKGGSGSCSGTLIGPRTVLTAAHCVYSVDDQEWLTDVVFAPGLNGFEDAPYGAFEAESMSILEGFVTNYQGFYGSVVPWDLGIITLKDPVGDNLGWLGYANYDELGDFTANIVGYPGDKTPPALMWRATCDVVAENVGIENFAYDCDTYPGSSGSAVYAYDEGLKQRVIVGVNVAESQAFNTAVRLNPAYVAWVNGLWK